MNSFKKVYIFLFISLIFVLVMGVVAVEKAHALSPEILFNRSLSLGDYGEDVLELQKVLNKDPDTRIAISGPGSLGQETQYFGSLTRGAVIKYQNKYSDEVLAPVGLTYGTGYFGPSTISHIQSRNIALDLNGDLETEDDLMERLLEILNQTNLDINTEVEPEVPEIQVNTNTTEQYDEFTIAYISHNVAERGDEVAVISSGINSTSRILLRSSGSDRIIYGKIIDTGIYFDVPRINYGTYQVYVKTGSELSEPVTLRIVDEVHPPKISTVSFPGDSIEYGETVTIKGERLSGQNTVMTLLGTYETYSSNASELSFVVEKPDDMDGLDAFSGKTLNGFVRIRNYNGDSNLKSVNFKYE